MKIPNLKMLVVVVVFVSGFAFAADKPSTAQKTCATADCHGKQKSQPHIHAPVELGDCKSCHKSVDVKKHTWKLANKVNDLCQSCHLEQGKMKNVHQPLKKGDCLSCHDPHGSKNKFLLHKKTVAEQCAECHDTAKHAKYLHGPVAVGECTICHDSHSSDHENLMKVEPKKLCLSCHVVTAEEMKNFDFVHEPAKGDCVGCHDPHGANNSKMLLGDGGSKMCYACHEDIMKIATKSKVKHDMIDEKTGCLGCHTPHASTVKNLLKKDPASLCLSCHDKEITKDKENKIPSFAEQIKDKKFPHGPVADKDCSGCHQPHGSDHFRLLTKDYPAIFYSPFKPENYELCFTCHSKDLVMTEDTSDLTDFRNGSKNMHYLHVNKDRRGRTCRACHQTHASNKPKHIRKSVPYGMWDLPVQFEKTETGGTCSPGCHAPKDYDRLNPVDYSKSDKPAETDKPAGTKAKAQ